MGLKIQDIVKSSRFSELGNLLKTKKKSGMLKSSDSDSSPGDVFPAETVLAPAKEPLIVF